MSLKFSKKSFTLVIILAAVALIFAYKYFDSRINLPSSSKYLSKVKGQAQAPVQITEFIDFQCPACAYGAKYLKKFMQEHPGIVRLEMKYFPLSSHKHAFLAAQYSECAAWQQKFWSFHDVLLERQAQWKILADAKGSFEKMANEVQLNRDQLNLCLQDENVMALIRKDKEEGKILGVRSTPTYFINGELFVGFKKLEEQLNKHIPEL